MDGGTLRPSGKRKSRGRGQISKGESEKPYLQKSLRRRQGITGSQGRGGSEPLGFWKVAIPTLLVLCFAFSRSNALPAGDPDDLQVVVGNTVEITVSRRYCWFPTVHQFSSGEIMATMRMSPDETNPEGDFSAYCISKDKGLTWSPRYTMGAGANVDGAYTESPRPDGSIWQLYGWVSSPPAAPPNNSI